MAGRYAVGIDLGTTHTVVAAAVRDGDEPAEVLSIPQLVTAHEVLALPLLPSTLYAPLDEERTSDPFAQAPWVLGAWARRRGAEVPGRFVSSSKSWLAHSGVDRTAPILPWGAPDDGPRISPVDAGARLLAHAARAWDDAHPDAPLAQQDVILTVPASFDEVARELSLEAAGRAGLSPKLLEEPQAAFYDWMHRSGWPKGRVAPGEPLLVLVVDVGGGTTDLSLVRLDGDGAVARVAVGPHVLLGGDNMDLALAHACESRLVAPPDRLDPARFSQLVQSCRVAKEALLGPSPPEDAPVTVLTRGAALVGGALATRLTQDDAASLVLEAFFPRVALDSRLERARGALVAFGLPYERDVAITRHVAAFLRRHLPSGAVPQAVLFNGGVFRSETLADRVLDVLGSWRADGGPRPTRLPGTEPDLAVACGAVAYARARVGRGLRIGGGSGRAYFVGIGPPSESPAAREHAVCVVSRGAEEGAPQVARGRTFALAIGRPARFELLASDDSNARPGDVVAVDHDRFARLPPVATTFAASSKKPDVPVAIEGELTPLGTVELACVELEGDPPRRHRLVFQLRDVVLDSAPHAHAPSRLPLAPPSQPPGGRLEPAIELLDRAFGKPRPDAGAREAKDLLRHLERALGERTQWTLETNRGLYDALLPLARGRRRSAEHERAFWLLAGWCVRPGFGAPQDAARTTALLQLFGDKLAFPQEVRGWQHFFIAWRRAAGGLDEAAQAALRDFVDPYLAPSADGRRPKRALLALDDALDMASSLERVAPARRAALGGSVLERTWTDRDPRLWTVLGRLGARVPAYASVHHVLSPAVAERWLDHLMREKWDAVPTAAGAAVLLARRTGDRARDVAERVRADVEQRLRAANAGDALIRYVREVVAEGERVRGTLFGDSLPLGLRLVE